MQLLHYWIWNLQKIEKVWKAEEGKKNTIILMFNTFFRPPNHFNSLGWVLPLCI